MMADIDFLGMDEPEMLAFLCDEWIEWNAAGFWRSSRAETFHRRAKILARRMGLSHADMIDVIRDEAEDIAAVARPTRRCDG